jgi:uncharacterized protein YggU (UPF0235/DUF167 family)
LANTLGISEKQLSLEHGERSPEKLMRIENISQEDLKKVLEEKFKK